jgi:hypothetical protein
MKLVHEAPETCPPRYLRTLACRWPEIPAAIGFMLLAGLSTAHLSAAESASGGSPWPRHVIDDSSRGADGVRLGDVNSDGLVDVVTGWEEGGITRVYVHPGHDRVREHWPAVTVGQTRSVEDAVLVDLDGDGRTDVVSSCEGGTRTVFVHWAPSEQKEYMVPEAWRTEALPASQNRMMWMFCLPLQVDGRGGIDLVVGAKGGDAEIGWFEAPEEPSDLSTWKWHTMSPAGWIMSLRAADMDGDGDSDILLSDRKGPQRGCRWLENPGSAGVSTAPWRNHVIGGSDHEVMFLTVADLDGDNNDEVLAATRDNGLLLFRRIGSGENQWATHAIPMPDNVGTGKGVAVGDLDDDGKGDIVFSCENARGDRSGVKWLSYEASPLGPTWNVHEISGPAGIKFDRLELVDLDGDGDLDVLACEESQPLDGKRRGLGVFWYENRL